MIRGLFFRIPLWLLYHYRGAYALPVSIDKFSRVRGRSRDNVVRSGHYRPLTGFRGGIYVVNTEVARSKGKRDRHRLTGNKGDSRKTAEIFYSAGNGAVVRLDIQLHHFVTGERTGVLDIDVHVDPVAGRNGRRARDIQTSKAARAWGYGRRGRSRDARRGSNPPGP